MNTNPDLKSNPLDLEGLDGFLEKGHVEVLDRKTETRLEDSQAYVDMRVTLELLDQVEKVRDLLKETNQRLTRAYSRVKHLESVVEDQEKKLTLLPGIQKEADRALQLQNKLDEAVSEIERLNKPWWRKINQISQD